MKKAASTGPFGWSAAALPGPPDYPGALHIPPALEGRSYLKDVFVRSGLCPSRGFGSRKNCAVQQNSLDVIARSASNEAIQSAQVWIASLRSQ